MSDKKKWDRARESEHVRNDKTLDDRADKSTPLTREDRQSTRDELPPTLPVEDTRDAETDQ